MSNKLPDKSTNIFVHKTCINCKQKTAIAQAANKAKEAAKWEHPSFSVHLWTVENRLFCDMPLVITSGHNTNDSVSYSSMNHGEFQLPNPQN